MRKRGKHTLICVLENNTNTLTFTPEYTKRQYLELILFSNKMSEQLNKIQYDKTVC